MSRGKMIGFAFCVALLAPPGSESVVGDDKASSQSASVVTKTFVYKPKPKRTMTVFYPDGWKASDRRSALVIFRCQIPFQREYFRRLGMVIIKPQLAPVNSGQLPKMSLDEIRSLPRPRHQVEDTKSAIRYLRTHAESLGIDPRRIVATGTSGGGDLALQSCINESFEDSNDDRSVPHGPNGLVLYCPAFDGIDIWFVRTEELLRRTRDEAAAFLPHLNRFTRHTPEGYSVPLDHRANLVKLAEQLGREEGIDAEQIARFQKVLQLFNERDWQLLHPVDDALKMSASRILPKEPLPPTLILLGDRDHLTQYQNAFITKARKAGQQFDLKLYQGGGHSFMTQPAFEEPSTRDVESFLVEYGFLPATPE